MPLARVPVSDQSSQPRFEGVKQAMFWQRIALTLRNPNMFFACPNIGFHVSVCAYSTFGEIHWACSFSRFLDFLHSALCQRCGSVLRHLERPNLALHHLEPQGAVEQICALPEDFAMKTQT